MIDAREPLLTVRGLRTVFDTDRGPAPAVDGVSFDLFPGKTLALVGESGCGKSVTALSILRLVPSPPGRIEAGEVFFNGRDLRRMPERDLRAVRGNDISMIFQEPMTSMNPVFRVGDQIVAVLRLHRGLNRADARDEAIALLKRVGIPAPERRVDNFPHEMSGGMLQRVMIAMALACGPKLLIADEPTTALDVTIQAQILDLLRQLQEETGMALLLITHDLGVVAENAHDVAVMYAGRIVERASAAELFRGPKHPYTQGLFASLPSMNKGARRLQTIEGNVPAVSNFPPGCRFHPRCPHVMERCMSEVPPDFRCGETHTAACWLRDPERTP
ncbi:MAG: ATP-binding cassette domain-containing protein [Candidatus Hydrogenedens sp.]|nr:ATP-binding cassette domain-containing protein [Candidatus Hydrogenedens sp.]